MEIEGIKNQSLMKFDRIKEAELIEHVCSLRDRHKLGDFNAACIRACWENPELFKKAGYTIEQFGLTDNRIKFFSDVERQMLELRRKVDTIYDIALKLYTLVQFGKRLGLEKKSEHLLQASFCVQKQVDEMSAILGISNLSHVWESNKLETTSQRAEDMLEFLIESYTDVMEELSSSIMSRQQQAYIVPEGHIGKLEYGHSKHNDEADRGTIPTIRSSADDNDRINASKRVDSSVTSTLDKQNQTKKDSNVVEVDLTGASEEIIDFGHGVDLGPLASFIGE